MAKHIDILFQGSLLLRKIVAQRIGKVIEALTQWKSLPTNRHMVKAVSIQPHPRQSHQSQLLENLMQGLSLRQSAYVVQTCIKFKVPPTIAL